MARVGASREIDPVDDLTMEIAEYSRIKEQVDDLSKRQKELRDSLLGAIENLGETDDQGNFWMELPKPVGDVRVLKRQRRVTQTLNQERALQLLEENGLLDQCSQMVRVVDEDALMAAKWDGALTEEQIDSMIDTKVVWALHLK